MKYVSLIIVIILKNITFISVNIEINENYELSIILVTVSFKVHNFKIFNNFDKNVLEKKIINSYAIKKSCCTKFVDSFTSWDKQFANSNSTIHRENIKILKGEVM